MIGHFDGVVYQPFLSMEDCLSYIVDHPDTLIFAHFGGKYDFQFLLQAALESTQLSFRIENIIPRGSGFLCFTLILVREGQPDKSIVFSDSSALLPMGLEKLTKGFDVKHKKLKETIDVSNLTKVTPELILYNEHDCRGLWECLEGFFSWPLVKKAGNALTIAGQSMRILRTFIDKPFYSLDDKVDAFIRKGYYGGRTEIFKPVHTKGNLYYYDVNSLYPYVMQKFEMPGEFSHDTDEYDTDEMAFLRCRVFVPDCFIPPLPVKHKGKLIFPTGKFEGIWSTVELKNAIKNYGVKILKVYEGKAFHNRGFIFKEFIEALWTIRKSAKKDSVDDVLSKLIMNSNYGRWGLRLERENLEFDEFNSELEPYREIRIGQDTVLLSKRRVELKAFTNVAVAAWVTSLARVHLTSVFSAAKEDVYYCDTDSIFTRKRIKTGFGLGQLKLADTVEQAVFLLPKTYCYQNSKGKKKTTMKGFPRKKIQHFEFEDFRLALAGDLSKLSIETEPKFATLKTALQKHCLLMKTKASKRQIKSLYDKREFVKNENHQWTSKPIHLNQKRGVK